jgi:predicted nucleic acid-binding protein
MPKSIHRAVVYPLRRSVKLRPVKSLPVKPSPAPVHSTVTYDFPSEKGYFFDTNIWLYIYGPIGWPDQMSSVYSRVLREVRDSNGTIYINCMIISEFINAFSRIEFKQQSTYSRFKDFRNSISFRPVAEDIASNVKKILRNTLACDPDLRVIDLPEIMSFFEQGKYDFNDLVFAEICRAKGLVFVTHDKDFSELGVEILTANEKLLRR